MDIASQRLSKPSNYPTDKNSGFTLFEMMIAAAMIGILAAIAAPSFLGFRERQRVENARNVVYQAMRATQMDAMQFREERQFSIRQIGGRVEWASHPKRVSVATISDWERLPKGVVIPESKDYTTLYKDTKNGVRYARFDLHGNVTSRKGTITLTGANIGKTKRCVIVSTIIGAMRKGEGHIKPNSNERYCY